MGKNVLESPGVVLGNPSALLRLLILFIPFVGLMADNPHHHPITLDMTRISHKSQWNISQTEFETKHREYFDLVEQNQRRRLNSSASYDEENIVRKKLFTFTHSGLKNSPSPPNGLINLNYNVHIPEESNRRTEVEGMSLRLLIVPTKCAALRKSLSVEVVLGGWSEGGGEEAVLGKEEVVLEKCWPKWVGVDLRGGLNAGPRSNFRVSIRCEECVLGNVRVKEQYLNVVVEVRRRSRRRRAEKKKRRRFPGKCVRHPWEVDLNKLKGYDYIVQPRKFDAGLCAGKCTGQWNLATQHSNLQYLFSNIDKSIPKPCCSPSKMESLEILYPDEDNPKKLKVSVWKDTKIVECACS